MQEQEERFVEKPIVQFEEYRGSCLYPKVYDAHFIRCSHNERKKRITLYYDDPVTRRIYEINPEDDPNFLLRLFVCGKPDGIFRKDQLTYDFAYDRKFKYKLLELEEEARIKGDIRLNGKYDVVKLRRTIPDLAVNAFRDKT